MAWDAEAESVEALFAVKFLAAKLLILVSKKSTKAFTVLRSISWVTQFEWAWGRE